ncbi:uncharacterized protein LOC119484914 [Sebastes umbrosus]|uniref:uncharacterized protein LOC119484914 n=1 Tax=Sebastes umbrosus TaxID=72105 RepID=UPI00189DD7CF|nr:uncharacterized protein LOC119484914 [Sebastes umbrosus]
MKVRTCPVKVSTLMSSPRVVRQMDPPDYKQPSESLKLLQLHWIHSITQTTLPSPPHDRLAAAQPNTSAAMLQAWTQPAESTIHTSNLTPTPRWKYSCYSGWVRLRSHCTLCSSVCNPDAVLQQQLKVSDLHRSACECLDAQVRLHETCRYGNSFESPLALTEEDRGPQQVEIFILGIEEEEEEEEEEEGISKNPRAARGGGGGGQEEEEARGPVHEPSLRNARGCRWRSQKPKTVNLD